VKVVKVLIVLFQNAAIQTLHKYGVGSCGPRGFYGTIGELILNNYRRFLVTSKIFDKSKLS